MQFAFTDFRFIKLPIAEIPMPRARNHAQKSFARKRTILRSTRFTAGVGEAGALLSAVSIVRAHKFAREFVESLTHTHTHIYTQTRDGLECSRKQIKTRRSRPRVIAGARRDLFL